MNISKGIGTEIAIRLASNKPIPAGADVFPFVLPFTPQGDDNELTAGELNTLAASIDSNTATITHVYKLVETAHDGYSKTGDLVETLLYTGTIPADSMGPNGVLEIVAFIASSADVNDKTVRVKINGVTIAEKALTTSTQNSSKISMHLINRNNTAAQLMAGPASGVANMDFINSTSNIQTYSFDTSQEMTVEITAQLIDNAAASVSVEHASFFTYFKN